MPFHDSDKPMKTAILISTDKLRAALVIPVRSTYRKRQVSHLPPSITAGYSDRCLCFHSKAKTTQAEQFTDHTAYRVFTLNMSRCPYYPIQTYLTSISKPFLHEHTVCSRSILITLKVTHLHLNQSPENFVQTCVFAEARGYDTRIELPHPASKLRAPWITACGDGYGGRSQILSQIYESGRYGICACGAGRWYGKVGMGKLAWG